MEESNTADARAYYSARSHSNPAHNQDPPCFPGFQNTPAQQHGQDSALSPVVDKQPQPVNMLVISTVEDNMGWAIFATFCCFWPLGVIAIILACQVKPALAANDISRARRRAEESKRMSRYSMIIGAIIVGVGVFLMVLRIPLYYYYY